MAFHALGYANAVTFLHHSQYRASAVYGYKYAVGQICGDFGLIVCKRRDVCKRGEILAYKRDYARRVLHPVFIGQIA